MSLLAYTQRPASRGKGRIATGSLTPVAAPNVSPNVFLAWGRLRRSGFGAIGLRDVAWGPVVETGASVPGQREVNFPVEH